MSIRAQTPRAWHEDRFMLALVIATGVHALVLLGVSFGISLKPVPQLADTLDVVLVKWRSEEAPEEADFLAQANQQGGGEVAERVRPTQPESAELPSVEQGEDSQQSLPAMPMPEVEQREVVVQVTEEAPSTEETRVEQEESPVPSAAQLMRQSQQLASLQPEVSRETQRTSKLPRREFISANTKAYEFASYMSAWVSKVERVGNMNYPSELRRRQLHGDLVLTVGINQDGSIESIDIMRSSGIDEIDRAAMNIVKMAAPYSPLPDNISDHVDVLHITRTWRFETSFMSN